MSYLKKEEQIHIENVEQLKTVYEVLKGEWSGAFSINEEIGYFFNKTLYCVVSWHNEAIALYSQDDNLTTITYDEFISQIEKPPIPIPTIIKSIDGKKYKAIILEEIKEPPTFWQWAKQHNRVNASSENIEDYVQYRIDLKNTKN